MKSTQITYDNQLFMLPSLQSLVESGRGKDVLLCSSSPIRDPEVEEKMKEMRVSKEKAEKENRKLKKQLQVR